MQQVRGALVMSLLRMLEFLQLIIVHHLILMIARIIFQCKMKDHLMILMAALVQEKKNLVILVKQRQNFAYACITIVIIVICLLTEKESISLKLIVKVSNF